uniref:MYND-type domain-containing protein n=1 Tax=Globisporangium ultimum (strain ATCC 200006 / CBS 805.95 / DAOM BR144) TaxID=431595 RepID=K3WX29_GLOUD
MHAHVRTMRSDGEAATYMALVAQANEAYQLSQKGKLLEAERLYRDLLSKKPGAGFDDVSVALSQNEYGIVLRQLGKFDEALAMLQTALVVCECHDQEAGVSTTLSDSNITRDEIAKVYEAMGDCEMAHQTREPGKRICGNGACQALQYKEQLHACTRCKCVFYCGKTCQRDDWKRHKAFCRPPRQAKPAAITTESAMTP